MDGPTPFRPLALAIASTLALGLSACSSHPESLAPPNLELVCSGEGTPTVILAPGMRSDASAFTSLQALIETDTRVCSYSRAGTGNSPPWPEDQPDPSVGMMADQLRATLDENGVPGPYVVLGWSFGGLVAQALALRHSDVVAGLVLEDSSDMSMLSEPVFDPADFVEAGRSFDFELSAEELDGQDFGDLPIVILTRGEPDGFDEATMAWWISAQDDMATRSTNVLHLIAVDAGHMIQFESEAIVEKAVDSVVEAVRSGEPLPECDDLEWGPYAGECRVP